MSLDKSIEELPVKRQSSMKYTKPLLERSRTISSSFMHDLGDGEEIRGENVTLNPNEGMIYLTGHIGRKIFKRLIPFKLVFDQGKLKKLCLSMLTLLYSHPVLHLSHLLLLLLLLLFLLHFLHLLLPLLPCFLLHLCNLLLLLLLLLFPPLFLLPPFLLHFSHLLLLLLLFLFFFFTFFLLFLFLFSFFT